MSPHGFASSSVYPRAHLPAVLLSRRDAIRRLGAGSLATALLTHHLGRAAAQDATPGVTPVASGAVEVVADGLTNPRGFTWGEDGTLYLALSGSGGTNPGPEGSPFTGGMTASVAIVRDGRAETFAADLPSAIWAEFNWVWGAMDVAFLDGELYVLDGGGGAGHGNPDAPSGVYRVAADGSATVVADLGTWIAQNPPARLPVEGFPNEGSLFAMLPVGGDLWVSDAVNAQILAVTPAGQISRVADLSTHRDTPITPDGLAPAPDGGVYAGDETVVPFVDGTATVTHVAPDGTVTDAWTGLTAVTGLAVGPDGALYAAEMSTGNLDQPPFLRRGAGRIVRQTGPDSAEEVATGLDLPVMIQFGPDGGLYVTQPAFGANNGEGSLLRLDLSAGTPIVVAGPGTPEAGTPTA
jgi:glucose/arabinose dehydrogenase